MGYGLLTAEMLGALTPHIRGKTVVDLGAGDCDKARTLLRLGASRLIAVDKAPMPPAEGVEQHIGYFTEVGEQLPEAFDVAFVAWPQNYYGPNGLVMLLERAKVIIYLGSNTDGNACGSRDLFTHMLTRKLEVYRPHRQNCLIIVSASTGRMRKPTHEEKAALSSELVRFSSR